MTKALVFDMDGTIADLYTVPNWLKKLRAEDASPYADARPMWDMSKMKSVLERAAANGWKIEIVTWLSKDSTASYKAAVRKAKREWLNKYSFPYDHFHGVRYGATKADSIRGKYDCAILIDDNSKVRGGWSLGPTINPNGVKLVEYLEQIVKEWE